MARPCRVPRSTALARLLGMRGFSLLDSLTLSRPPAPYRRASDHGLPSPRSRLRRPGTEGAGRARRPSPPVAQFGSPVGELLHEMCPFEGDLAVGYVDPPAGPEDAIRPASKRYPRRGRFFPWTTSDRRRWMPAGPAGRGTGSAADDSGSPSSGRAARPARAGLRATAPPARANRGIGDGCSTAAWLVHRA